MIVLSYENMSKHLTGSVGCFFVPDIYVGHIVLERWCCMMAKLNDRQKRFCDEYLIDLNATQAAIRAGFTAKYANTNAPKLLQNTSINEEIQK